VTDFLYFTAVTAWSVALARVDFREHRLPDRLTLPAIPIAAGLVAWSRPEALTFAVGAAIATGTAGLLSQRFADLGWGDVKLLPSVGLLAANSANPADGLVEWFVAMAMIAGIHAVIHLVITRDLRSHIPFGPSILGGMLWSIISG
jgi:leader peptidase (prepilin peptidase)/N-methyltransferase